MFITLNSRLPFSPIHLLDMMVADGECCSDNNVYDSSSDMDTTMDEVAELNENLATDKIIAAELDEEPDDAVHCWLYCCHHKE